MNKSFIEGRLPCLYTTLFMKKSNAFKINSIIVATVNIIAAVPTILLNYLICVAFLRKGSLRRKGNKILLSLSISDFSSGFVTQPSISIMLIIGVTRGPLDIPCQMVTFTSIGGHTLACVSLLTVSFISLERYLAIFHPYIYGRNISSRPICIICVLLWIVSFFAICTTILLNLTGIFFWMNAILIGFAYVWNIFVYISITRKLNQIRRELNERRERFTVSNEVIAREKQTKGTRVAGAIVVCLLLSYLPQVLMNLWRAIVFHGDFIDFYGEYWSMTFGLLNACLNPIFYCYYNSDIRKEVFSMLCCSNNTTKQLPKKNDTGFTNMNFSQSQDSIPSVVELKRRYFFPST